MQFEEKNIRSIVFCSIEISSFLSISMHLNFWIMVVGKHRRRFNFGDGKVCLAWMINIYLIYVLLTELIYKEKHIDFYIFIVDSLAKELDC